MIGLKNSLVNYFKKAEKKNFNHNLGIEVEHFILDKKEMTSISYAGDKGIQQLLLALMDKYPEARPINEGSFLGFNLPEFSITLEPAAQLEISIAPSESVEWIEEVYKDFLKNLEEVLDRFGYIAKNAGGQPISKVKDLKLIPKRRYELMNEHFGKIGSGGMEMMRGTASLQASIDYRNESDFRDKFQAAYFYGPILKILCDNTDIFQGEEVKGYLKRTDIWRRTDPNRCGIIPGVFSKDFGYENYADFICNLIPILIKDGEEIIPTGNKKATDIYEGKSLNDGEIAHLLSMAFPDVRLKQFIEIRFADSVEYPFASAYAALIKGLLYSKEGIAFAQSFILNKNLKDEDILNSEDELMEKGWKAYVYNRPVKELATCILKIAERNLPPEEKLYLEPFTAVIEYGGITKIPEDKLKEIFEKSNENRRYIYEITGTGI